MLRTQTAQETPIIDTAGKFSSSNVEGALLELSPILGSGNTVSGTNAAALSGNGNTASGTNSVVSGENGNTQGLMDSRVLASAQFAAGAPAQYIEVVLSKIATAAIAATLTADRNAASANNVLALPNNTSMTVFGHAVARDTSTNDTAGWSFTAVIRRGANAAATALVAAATVTVIAADAGAVSWVLAVTADTTLGALKITIRGEAGKTIDCTAVVRAVQAS